MNTKDIEDLKRVDAIIDRHSRAMREGETAAIEPVLFRFADNDPVPTGRHRLVAYGVVPTLLADDARRDRVLAVAREAMADFGREREKRQRRRIDNLVANMTRAEQLDGLAAAIKGVVHAPRFDARVSDETIVLLGFDPASGSIARRTAQRVLDSFRSECAAVREECLGELRAMGLTVEG